MPSPGESRLRKFNSLIKELLEFQTIFRTKANKYESYLMEQFYTYLLLAGILFVISLFSGVEFLISENDYAGTRFVELIVATFVALLFCLRHYISAQIKEKKESGKNHNRRSPSR